MKRTFVCIVDQEAIINYIFLREALGYDDSILLIAAKQYSEQAKNFGNLYADNYEIEYLILEEYGDEIIWDKMCRTFRSHLKREEHYYVNLSGGTRLMSIAVQQVFKESHALFFFIPFDRNIVVHSQIDNNNDNNDDIFYPIKHKVSVEEYLMVNQLTYKSKQPSQPFSYTKHFCELFTNGMFSQQDFEVLEELRDLRNNYITLSNASKHAITPKILAFLKFVEFKPEHPHQLAPTEVQYLTGNWFEEYLYHTLKEVINPDDIALGVEMRKVNGETCNDIDIAFTLNNQLYAIECKTGVGKRSLFNQIVYKACALNEALLGIRSFSFIFSLNTDYDTILQRMAQNMNIGYCDRKVVFNHTLLKETLLKKSKA